MTWVPLIWGVLCGAAASGHFTWTFENVGKSMLCMFMSGPLLTGYTQTINDWYDREIDAINEPNRPIPVGRDQRRSRSKCPDVGAAARRLGRGRAYGLDEWCGTRVARSSPASAVGGSWVSYIYSRRR